MKDKTQISKNFKILSSRIKFLVSQKSDFNNKRMNETIYFENLLFPRMTNCRNWKYRNVFLISKSFVGYNSELISQKIIRENKLSWDVDYIHQFTCIEFDWKKYILTIKVFFQFLTTCGLSSRGHKTLFVPFHSPSSPDFVKIREGNKIGERKSKKEKENKIKEFSNFISRSFFDFPPAIFFLLLFW